MGFIHILKVIESNLQYRMQQENNQSNSKISKISIESGRSSFSVFKAIQKQNPNQYRHSRESLQYVMSIQSDRRSDIYEKLLDEQQRTKPAGTGSGMVLKIDPTSNLSSDSYRRSIQINYSQNNKQNYFGSDMSIKNNQLSYPTLDLQQTQSDLKKKNQIVDSSNIFHTCICDESKCLAKQCLCFDASQDMCIPNLCCSKCVQLKQKMLTGWQDDDFKPCTCKKTKCNKKYCACYAAGRKCTRQCSCDQCTNCDQIYYQPIKYQKPKAYIQEQYQNKVNMPQSMDFQPFNYN